jgi:hypothetical protein
MTRSVFPFKLLDLINQRYVHAVNYVSYFTLSTQNLLCSMANPATLKWKKEVLPLMGAVV